MAREQPTKPRRSLVLGYYDHNLFSLVRTRYSSTESSSTTTSSAMQATSEIKLVNSLYFLENTLSLHVVENLGTNVLFVDAHPVHHFIDELSPVAVLSPLLVGSSINLSMEDIDEGIEEGSEGEHNTEGKGSSGSDLEVIEITPSTGLTYRSSLCKGACFYSSANIAHYISYPYYSDIKGTGLEEEADFDEVTKVLTRNTGIVWPETNRLNSKPDENAIQSPV
ncbi:hypothetical protein M9H77_17292 [Catharanthus roseus]|uniref:Uncharacterized protein n=1 Tax=Catharanthus roseus TaxID=4058 RepID=A0ACC0B470_CATRO|nr:hypothetical protein M9H77_17292 [Catharanthus roseus]